MNAEKGSFNSRPRLSRIVVPYNPARPAEHLAQAQNNRRRVRSAVAKGAGVALALASVVGGAAYAKGSIDSSDLTDVYEHFSQKQLTHDQKRAAEVYASDALSSGHVVFNVEVWGEEINGKRIANLRNKPLAPNALDDVAGGQYLGQAEIGSVIPKVIVVNGNNPGALRQDDPKHDDWIAYPDPKDPNIFFFMSVNELTPASRVAVMSAEAVDLSK